MKTTLKINIYGMAVEIITENQVLENNLREDFSYFIVEEFKSTQKKFVISVFNQSYEDLLPKKKIANKQTDNSIYYDIGDIRYNEYYGKALTITDFKNLSAEVYYIKENFIHELIYLMILSFTGKYMDSNGMHKVHACGINKNEKNLIMMMPSKGGKTTLFCDLISDPTMNIISDDTPVITNKGEVLPFPLRIGSESELFLRERFSYITIDELREFKREHYSEKTLLSLSSLKNKVRTSKKTILVVGHRSTYDEPSLRKISSLTMIKNLLTHMVVGLGLPMIVEYFLRNNIKDHFLNLMIFYSRLKAAIIIASRSENYEFISSSDLDKNKRKIQSLLK